MQVYENDTVSINVINNLISESTSIHWHGVHPVDAPWMDGAVGVTQVMCLFSVCTWCFC